MKNVGRAVVLKMFSFQNIFCLIIHWSQVQDFLVQVASKISNLTNVINKEVFTLLFIPQCNSACIRVQNQEGQRTVKIIKCLSFTLQGVQITWIYISGDFQGGGGKAPLAPLIQALCLYNKKTLANNFSIEGIIFPAWIFLKNAQFFN